MTQATKITGITEILDKCKQGADDAAKISQEDIDESTKRMKHPTMNIEEDFKGFIRHAVSLRETLIGAYLISAEKGIAKDISARRYVIEMRKRDEDLLARLLTLLKIQGYVTEVTTDSYSQNIVMTW